MAEQVKKLIIDSIEFGKIQSRKAADFTFEKVKNYATSEVVSRASYSIYTDYIKGIGYCTYFVLHSFNYRTDDFLIIEDFKKENPDHLDCINWALRTRSVIKQLAFDEIQIADKNSNEYFEEFCQICLEYNTLVLNAINQGIFDCFNESASYISEKWLRRNKKRKITPSF